MGTEQTFTNNQLTFTMAFSTYHLYFVLLITLFNHGMKMLIGHVGVVSIFHTSQFTLFNVFPHSLHYTTFEVTIIGMTLT